MESRFTLRKACDCGKNMNCTFKPRILSDGKKCVCPTGYIDVAGKCKGGCRLTPCKRGTCEDGPGTTYKCICPEGYFGDKCEIKDLCLSNPCENGATCTMIGATKNCTCPVPYSGPNCEKNPCFSKPCINGGNCTVAGSTFKCSCKTPYYGSKCENDPCTKKPCHNGGNCSVSGQSFKCKCKLPYFGDLCDNDPCSSSPCKNGGTCKVTGDSYKCECKDPFYGDMCEKKECTCENGKCIDTNNGTKCVCNPEYGPYEEGVCKACHCGPGANCTFDVGFWLDDIHCICPSGYKVEGEKCIPYVIPSSSAGTTTEMPSRKTETAQSPSEGVVTESQTTPASTTVLFPSSSSGTTTRLPSTLNETEGSTSVSLATESQTNPTNTTDATPTTAETETITVTGDTKYSVTNSETTITRTDSTRVFDPCEPNPCYNGGTCKIINEMIYCFCRDSYGGRFCREGKWCAEGWGATLCPHDCNFNFTTNIGRCVCLPGQLYNHNLKKCEAVDMCPYMSDQCKGKNEICLNSTCQCEENYKRNDKNECVPNFCESKFNPCGSNAICEDVADQPKHMKCSCKDGYTSIGSSCEKINKCSVPGVLRCQHTCNISTETCECLPGYKLLPNGISCEAIDQNTTCTKACGVGVCKKTGTDEECVCPSTHTWNGTTCVDLCTFNQGIKFCPGGKCTPDKTVGFKCVCEGPYLYSNDNVTCKPRSMCYEGNGIQKCAEKGATCWDDFSVREGYRCDCPIDQVKDTDGKCKNLCDLKENQDHCIKKQGTCSTDGGRIKCVCPPLVTQDTEGNCNKLA
ncbi:neurogenic locus notch homolog protein 1-like [Uloborus diversus]|uniref:neurogenic locus notch homolog protein 1-like n=1 Tax=Uloborus diversus TaxID=327109 RepID=UPI0024097F5E|nr:neurogenic locus notch homolog protein 1-like [Uloborus diversus]